jgi:hypothetical protein
MTWFTLSVMNARPFLGGPGRWSRTAVITPILAISAVRTQARYGTIAQKAGNRDDYSILVRNRDVRSHFSSETGTSNTTVFTMPLR